MNSGNLPHNHGEHGVWDIPHDDNFLVISDIFKILSDASRIKIFWVLCHCEECVTNISAMVEMSSPAVSHHLKQLKLSGLIVSRRQGKEVYYKASDNETASLLHMMIEHIEKIACPKE